MSVVLPRFFIVALLLAFAACGQNESAKPGAVQTTAKPATPTPTEQPSVATQPAAGTDAAPEKPNAEAPPVEPVTETVENPEPADEPAPKNSMPALKLAQLPVRAATNSNSRFKEGVNYQRLSPTQPVDVPPDQVEIAEVFWYGCPHCNALDPALENWRKGAPPNGKAPYVSFVRIPAAWNEVTRFHGRFYYAAEALGKLEELHPLIFQEIHVNGNPLNTLDKARDFFVAHGVDAKDFQKAFGSLSIEHKLDNAVLLAQRYHATGVPHLVVNGKYITDVGLAGSAEQLVQLLNELAAREHAKE